MPCADVTEILRIILDKDDCVVSYALNKLTCGGSVGTQSLVFDWIRDKHASDIVHESIENFLMHHPTEDIVEEFLMLKHFFAIQNGLKALLGYEDGGVQSPCMVDRILYSDSGIEFTARIKVNVLTEQIKSCGSCRSCGTKNLTLARKIKAVSLM